MTHLMGAHRRTSHRKTIFAALALAALSFPFAAFAADRPVKDAITVDPGATCLDASLLDEHIETWLEASTVDADVSVVVRGSPDDARTVEFTILRAGHVIAQRRFAPGPARCDHLHAAVGLAIAMAIKASLVEAITGTPSPPPPPPPSPAPPPPAPAPEPSASWALGADALGALATLPDPALGLDARVERSLGPTFGVRLGVLALGSVGERFDNGAGKFDAWLLAGRADLCAAADAARRVRVRGCMGVAVGAIHANGYDLPSPASQFVRWTAVANGLDVTTDLGKDWAFFVGATLFLPVARNSIVVRDTSDRVVESRDLASVGGFLAVGPVFRF